MLTDIFTHVYLFVSLLSDRAIQLNPDRVGLSEIQWLVSICR